MNDYSIDDDNYLLYDCFSSIKFENKKEKWIYKQRLGVLESLSIRPIDYEFDNRPMIMDNYSLIIDMPIYFTETGFISDMNEYLSKELEKYDFLKNAMTEPRILYDEDRGLFLAFGVNKDFLTKSNKVEMNEVEFISNARNEISLLLSKYFKPSSCTL